MPPLATDGFLPRIFIQRAEISLDFFGLRSRPFVVHSEERLAFGCLKAELAVPPFARRSNARPDQFQAAIPGQFGEFIDIHRLSNA